MNTLHTDISRQNQQAAASNLSSGDLYLAILNRGLETTLREAAIRHEMRCVAFSCGAGACQVRKWEGGAA